MHRVWKLRLALGLDATPKPEQFNPSRDSLIRRVAQQLPDELVDDVAALIETARTS